MMTAITRSFYEKIIVCIRCNGSPVYVCIPTEKQTLPEGFFFLSWQSMVLHIQIKRLSKMSSDCVFSSCTYSYRTAGS